MAKIRYTFLLPVTKGAKELGAKRALKLLRAAFPSGGTWLSAPDLVPVVGGWWANGVIDELDEHILVMMDDESVGPVDDTNLRAIASLMRFSYREAPESEYYVATSAVGIHRIRG